MSDNLDGFYTVSAYYYRAEASFSFGPFKTWEEADTFAEKMWDSDKCGEPYPTYHNSPELFGTGLELNT